MPDGRQRVREPEEGYRNMGKWYFDGARPGSLTVTLSGPGA